MGEEPIDFNELNGQLEIIVRDLGMKERKKAVSYYLKESTIERIKAAAQKYKLKDSQFLEEVICKLLELIESQSDPYSQQEPDEPVDENHEDDINNPDQDLSIIQESATPTPWGRLNAKKQSEKKASEGNENRKEEEANKKCAYERETKNISEEQWVEYQKQIEDFIFENFRPDYRILYSRFEKKVMSRIEMKESILMTIVKKLDRSGEITYFEKQNLLDINKKIFEERLPNVKDLTEYYDDSEVIE